MNKENKAKVIVEDVEEVIVEVVKAPFKIVSDLAKWATDWM